MRGQKKQTVRGNLSFVATATLGCMTSKPAWPDRVSHPLNVADGNMYDYIVRRQICCWSRASGVVPSTVSVVFRLVRSWAVAFGCVSLSRVSDWLRLVELFAVVPLGVSCFLSCGVGGYCVAR